MALTRILGSFKDAILTNVVSSSAQIASDVSGSIVGGVSGSSVSTGSFGRVEVAGNLSVSANLPNTPAFAVTLSGTQVISSVTVTKMQYDTEVLDSDDAFDVASYRFTPQKEGFYYIHHQLQLFRLDHGKRVLLYILKNGGTAKYGMGTHSDPDTELYDFIGNISCLVQLNGSTDYIEGQVYTNHGSNINAEVGVNHMFGFRVI